MQIKCSINQSIDDRLIHDELKNRAPRALAGGGGIEFHAVLAPPAGGLVGQVVRLRKMETNAPTK
jgi:hypothetical protein